MGFWNITCSVIIAIVACGSAALAGMVVVQLEWLGQAVLVVLSNAS